MSQTLTFLCKSKNGVEVMFDAIHSHVATHFEDTPPLKDLVVEAISKMNLADKVVARHVDMGRAVGTCDVVNVDERDEIVYGVRKNRHEDGLVPFVKNREGDPCSNVALHLVPQPDKSYVLSSAWIGTFDDQPFPLAPDAMPRSVEFWDKHAFVWGSQEIEQGTETATKPW